MSKNIKTTICASCPFLPQNHKEFSAVAERLCAKFGQPKPDFWRCLSIRESVKQDAIESGRLQCHSTVYDAKMNPHPETSRPCAGLADYINGQTPTTKKLPTKTKTQAKANKHIIMKNKNIRGFSTMAALGAAGVGLALLVIIISIWASVSNNEVRLRNAIAAKQKANVVELDNMQKKIIQTAQVTREQARALKDLVVGYAAARTGGGDGKLATLVREAVPQLDQSTFGKLMNIITASRDGFTMRQTELLDMKREHDNARTTFIGSIVCGSRPEIIVTVVSSAKAEEAFSTGQDNDTNLFNK